MPDTKFSLSALREHLRRYLWIYVVGIVLCLLGTNLLWTVTRPRPTNDQTVNIDLLDSYGNPEPLEGVAADMLARTQPFDENLQEVSFQPLMYIEDDYNSGMLLLTRLAVGEGDAFLTGQVGMDALVNSQVLQPLDDYVAAGWPGDYGLEPYYATYEDEEAGTSETFLAGLRLDGVNRLSESNVETTMKALEFMLQDLTEGDYAAAGASEPAA